MKLFKNPFFALVLCLLIIVCSTCLSAKVKMEKRYDRICDRLYDEVLDFVDDNGLNELKTRARESAANGDYRALISAFNEFSSAHSYHDTDDVDDQILAYSKFLRKTQQFPAKIFVDLLHITF